MSLQPGAAGRVLLVEDELSIAEPFAQALDRSGFETTIAPTAGEALQLARTVDPDVVLLDLTLPERLRPRCSSGPPRDVQPVPYRWSTARRASSCIPSREPETAPLEHPRRPRLNTRGGPA